LVWKNEMVLQWSLEESLYCPQYSERHLPTLEMDRDPEKNMLYDAEVLPHSPIISF